MTTEMPKKRSRQAEQQARLIKEGRCMSCWKKRPKRNATQCDECLTRTSARVRRRLGCKAWEPGKAGRPPKWYRTLLFTKGREYADEEARRRAREAV